MDPALIVIFALLPILGLMIALGVFRVPAHWAGLGTLVLTLPSPFGSSRPIYSFWLTQDWKELSSLCGLS
jgi:hypothetical protein